jgi:hypothetical protein
MLDQDEVCVPMGSQILCAATIGLAQTARQHWGGKDGTASRQSARHARALRPGGRSGPSPPPTHTPHPTRTTGTAYGGAKLVVAALWTLRGFNRPTDIDLSRWASSQRGQGAHIAVVRNEPVGGGRRLVGRRPATHTHTHTHTAHRPPHPPPLCCISTAGVEVPVGCWVHVR